MWVVLAWAGLPSLTKQLFGHNRRRVQLHPPADLGVIHLGLTCYPGQFVNDVNAFLEGG